MPPKAVSKDALLIILDCGPDSAIQASKDGETFFSRAKKCVLRIFEQKIFGNSMDEIGLLLMGPETRNELYNPENEGCYEHLAQVLELKRASWESARFIDHSVQASDTQADWFDALVLGIDILHGKCESRCYDNMKIVLMTTFASTLPTVTPDTKKKVIENMKEGTDNMGQIELIVINDNIEYVQDFEHEDPHFSQAPQKSQAQQSSEQLILEIVNETDGVLCNLENAELQVVYFEKKKVKGRPNPYSFKIGTQITIEVAEYVKITEPRFLDSWKTMYTTTGEEVKKTIKYFQNDEEIKAIPEVKNPVAAENQQPPIGALNSSASLSSATHPTRNDAMEVDDNVVEIITGYMYGSTAVPFESSLKQNFGEKSLMCIGFSDRKYVLSEYLSGKGCHVILPQLKYKSSPKKFAALVKALSEMNYVIIARKVYNKSSSPKIVAMFPEYTEDGKPFLTMIGLHFMEDCIDIKFPSLRHTKKFKPTQEQYNVMDQLINSMDLMTAGNEKSGNAEAFSLNKTLNPVNQHMCRVIAHRALHPHEPVQQISEELTELIDVPIKIQNMSRDTLLKAKELFVLEEVQKRSKMQLLEERLNRINEKAAGITGVSENAIEQNLPVDSQIDHVGTVTPGEDFVFLVDKGISDFGTAAKQLQEVVNKITFQAFSVPRVKITKALVAYREMAKDMRPHNYNDWIVTYKEELFSKDKQDIFTQVIVQEELGLILSTDSHQSSITAEKGEKFYRTDDIPAKRTTIAPSNDDDDDVMDLIE